MRPDEYHVAVISHRRPQRCAERTLAVLEKGGITRDRVTVHVSDPADVPAYRAAAPGWHIAAGAPGLAGNRNHVSSIYPAGQPLVCCDDDIQGIDALMPGGRSLWPVADLHVLFISAFHQAALAGATLWGTAPSSNPFYMRPGTSRGLKFCIGVLHGVINRPAEKLTCHCKDDYERTLLRWEKDGTVIRLDDVVARHTYDGNAGGLAAINGRTVDKAQADVHYLMQRWPGVVRLNTTRKSPYPEILLRAPKARI